MSTSPKLVQQKILEFLAQRAMGRNERYCITKTICDGIGYVGSLQYFHTLIDDLEIRGLVHTRQQYRVSGGRFFQISVAGLEAVRSGNAIESLALVSPTAATVSSHQITQVLRLVDDIETEAEKLSENNAKSQILGITKAVRILLELPQPPKGIILQLFRDDAFGNLTQFALLVAAVFAVLGA